MSKERQEKVIKKLSENHVYLFLFQKVRKLIISVLVTI